MGGRLIPTDKGVREMTVYEALMLMVNFTNFVVNLLSYHKKK